MKQVPRSGVSIENVYEIQQEDHATGGLPGIIPSFNISRTRAICIFKTGVIILFSLQCSSYLDNDDGLLNEQISSTYIESYFQGHFHPVLFPLLTLCYTVITFAILASPCYLTLLLFYKCNNYIKQN
jgi:hypothetical protein